MPHMQDPQPKPQEPKPSILGTNEERRAALDSIIKALQSNQKMRHAEEKHDQELEHASRAQMLTEAQQTRSEVLNNQKTELDIEVKKQEAVAKGISLPNQDPVTPIPPAQYKNKSLEDAISSLRSGIEAKSKDNLASQSATQEFVRQLDSAAKEAFEEKRLKYAPTGFIGQTLGQILNIIPGLELGTTIFGGRMPAEARAQLIASNLYKTSPLVRTELNNLIAEDKLERGDTIRRYRSMPRTAAISQGNADMDDAIGVTRMEIDALLSKDPILKQWFGSESILGRSLHAFESVRAGVNASQDPTLSDTEKLAKLEQAVKDEAMAAGFAEEYFNTGGDPAKLQSVVSQAQDKIGTFVKFLDPTMPGLTKHQLDYTAARNLTANEYANMLTQWLAQVSERYTGGPSAPARKEEATKQDLNARVEAAIAPYGFSNTSSMLSKIAKGSVAFDDIAAQLPEDIREAALKEMKRRFKATQDWKAKLDKRYGSGGLLNNLNRFMEEKFDGAPIK